MSHIGSKLSAILISLAIFANVFPALVTAAPIRPAIKPLPVNKDASSAANTGYAIQNRINNIRDNAENRIENLREKIASKEAALKAKLQKFKDQKKANLAEKINTNLNRINQNQTAQMQQNLNNMATILTKLEQRVNTPTPDIKDPAAAKTAIISAKAAIASASAAVSAQAQKDYTIQVSSESRIRIDAKLQRDNLHKDLQATRKLVIDTKHAIANAIRIAKSGSVSTTAIPTQEGTSSGRK